MKRFIGITVLLICVISNPVQADDSSTEIGLYGFLSSVSGETQIRNVTADLDVSFSDLLENLKLGAMAFVQHRHGRWSFIADIYYVELDAEGTTARNSRRSVKIDADLEQTLLEGFVGYRILAQQYQNASFGIDLLAGLRYNNIGVDLSAEASALGLTASGSRSRDEDWVDGVAGLRAQYNLSNGFGISGWADVGVGSDSNSFQLAGFLNYTFGNNVKLFGGYRYYSFDFEDGDGANRFEIDADYAGPMIGFSYTF